MNHSPPTEIEKAPAAPLAEVVKEIGTLIRQVDGPLYRERVSELFTSSIGAQVRHTLDHVSTFLQGVDCGRMEYDRRERGTKIETEKEAAIRLIESLYEGLLQITPDQMEQSVEVVVMLHHQQEPVTLKSTVGREIGFILNHTIHHNAILSVMSKQIGMESPSSGFGYAPATLSFLSNS